MCKSSAQRVTVIGSGNAGLTAAYHFSRNGADVCLYGAPGFDAPLQDIKAKGGIHAIDSLNGVTLSFSGFSKVSYRHQQYQGSGELLRYSCSSGAILCPDTPL